MPLCYVCLTQPRSIKNDRYVKTRAILFAALIVTSYGCFVTHSREANASTNAMEKRGQEAFEARLRQLEGKNSQ
jgi:hypothetical protein